MPPTGNPHPLQEPPPPLSLCVHVGTPPFVQPPPLSIPPPRGGGRHLAREHQKINRKSQAPKKNFSWVD